MVIMKSALLKDTFREIKNTLSRFLSIFAIVALGVAFFAGIKASAHDMELTGDKYFDDYNLMDIRLVSTLGFDEKDISAIKETGGLAGVLPAYSLDAIAELKDKETVIKVLSLPTEKVKKPDSSYINRTRLVAGRYPEKPDECVTEEAKMLNTEVAIGSKIKLSSGKEEDISESLKFSEYTVVGIVETPYYLSAERGTSTIGNGKVSSFIMIPEENFELPVYTDVFVTIEGAREAFTFDQQYKDIVKPVTDSLESTAKNREQGRYEEIMSEANEKLQDSKNELLEAEEKANEELKKAEDKLASGRRKLSEGERELNKKEGEFKSSIAAGEEQLAQGIKQLEAGEREYQLQLAAFEQAKNTMPMDIAAATEAKLQETNKALAGTRLKLEAENKRLESSKATAESEFAAARRKLESSRRELEEGQQEYEEAKKEAEDKLSDARIKIAEAEDKIKELEKPSWYVLGRDKNLGYVDYELSAERIAAIAQVFPVFFFLIAALVCLTTMTRMVDEQRNYIGTLKALGYSKLSIASKYLLYAALASVSGSIFGFMVGFKVFPTIIVNAYRIMFTLPFIITAFNTYYAVLSTVIVVGITTLSAWFACNQELAAEPSVLMRPKAPKAGKRIFIERVKPIWSRLNFTQKITARNIFRYKKRFLMTVLGISGCTALLLSGFGLKDSILSIAAIQFDELYKYDMVIQLKKDISIGESTELIKQIRGDNRISDYMLTREQSVDVVSGSIEKSVSLIVPESSNRLEDFITFRIRGTDERVPFGEDGIMITEKLAKQLSVGVGDSIEIKNDEKNNVSVKISGITEHYISHYVYMSPDIYRSVFGKEVGFKQIMAKTIEASESFENKLSRELLKNKDISSIRFTTGISHDFRRILDTLNYVIIVLIFSAGALAFVVLYNLTNVNVTERIREIATIKVLGFFDREVSAYVDRESTILTLIGTLAGLVLGVFFHRYLIVTVEIEYVMFGRNIDFLSYVYAAILTLAFSAMVNIVMHFRLKKINMVESLKSVD